MSIGMARQDGQFVKVYDIKNMPLFTREGKLHGYTGSTVNIIRPDGKFIYMYDEKGMMIGSQPV